MVSERRFGAASQAPGPEARSLSPIPNPQSPIPNPQSRSLILTDMEHIIPRRTYYLVFAALMIGTWLTVQAAYVDLGPFNAYIALTIAVIKATLVVLFFMHVRYATRLTKLTVIAGFFWLGIMIVLTLSDYLTRGWIRGWVEAGPVTR
jgi:cytochrome c oxidase subunit IV